MLNKRQDFDDVDLNVYIGTDRDDDMLERIAMVSTLAEYSRGMSIRVRST